MDSVELCGPVVPDLSACPGLVAGAAVLQLAASRCLPAYHAAYHNRGVDGQSGTCQSSHCYGVRPLPMPVS